MEFGREVYGVPGNVAEPMSFAPNQLIKQGAKLVTNWQEVVEELPTEVRAELFPVEATTAEERASLFEGSLSPTEKRLFELIRIEEPIHVDELVEKTGLSSSETLAALCEMEMRGGDPADAGETVCEGAALGARLWFCYGWKREEAKRDSPQRHPGRKETRFDCARSDRGRGKRGAFWVSYVCFR